MSNKLLLSHYYSLQSLNTFGVAAIAKAFFQLTELEQLTELLADPVLSAMPRLILGGGSNLVLSDQIDALVIQMRLMGRRILHEDEHNTYVEAEAGENWHNFVQWTLKQGLGGLENLSLIPGTVGAAPIQNIGAYGVEIKDFFDSLRAFDLYTGKLLTISKADCCFAYRDSIFKQAFKDRMVILSVRFALPKRWQAQITYADVSNYLSQHQIVSPTPEDVSSAIISIRQAKLPDPKLIGNAGSFFKNPIVSSESKEQLLKKFPQLVHYAQPDGTYKLAAGWLIEQCGWKGRQLGRAGVYDKQALVLVNCGGASGEEIRTLAQCIQNDVQSVFGVLLETEPVFC